MSNKKTIVYRPIPMPLEDIENNLNELIDELDNFITNYDEIEKLIMDIMPDDNMDVFKNDIEYAKKQFNLDISNFFYDWERYGTFPKDPSFNQLEDEYIGIFEVIFDTVQGRQYLTAAMDMLDIEYPCKECITWPICLHDETTFHRSSSRGCNKIEYLVPEELYLFMIFKVSKERVN